MPRGNTAQWEVLDPLAVWLALAVDPGDSFTTEDAEAGLVELGLEIDDPVLSERRDRQAGFGIERNEVIARSHREDSFVAFPIRPIRDPATRAKPRRHLAALAFVHPPHPQLLARFRIDGDNRAPHAGLRAWHTRRPWKITQWDSIVQSFLGISAPIA